LNRATSTLEGAVFLFVLAVYPQRTEEFQDAARLKDHYAKEYWAARKIAYNAYSKQRRSFNVESIKSNVESAI
jgi:hypothetical protein